MFGTHDIFCLNCRSANSLDRKTCAECGFPLPNQIGFDQGRDDSLELFAGEDHLENRVDRLEDRLAGVTGTVEEILRILQSLPSQVPVETVSVEPLENEEPYDFDVSLDNTLESFWNERLSGYLQFIEKRESYNRQTNRISGLYEGEDKEKIIRLIERSQILFYSNQQKKALRLLERALRLDPANYELLYFIGAKYFFSKQLDKAAEIWERVLDLKPDHYDAAVMLGIVQMLQGKSDNARKHLLHASRQDERSTLAFLALATLELQESRFIAALDYTRLANDLNETAFGHILMAENYSRINRPRKAMKELEIAAGLQPEDSQVLLRLATTYLKLGFIRRARSTFSRISRLNPQNEFFRALANKSTKPEMLALMQGREGMSDSSFRIDSVSQLLLKEVE